MGGIYTGTVFPSAAGAVGAAGAFLIAVLRRRMNAGKFAIAVKDAVSISASLLFIIVGGLMLTRVLLASGFVSEITDAVLSLGLSQTTFILMIIVLYLILGIFVDGISLMVMTVPILHPIAMAFGIDGIWFAIIVVKLIEIAIISPPVGMNLYAVIGASGGKITSGGLFWGVMPFMVLECISLAIIVMWPELSLFLPRTMMAQ